MINSLIGSIMNMKCDIYIQKNNQTTSGAIQREWIYNATIDCRAEPMQVSGTTSRNDNKVFDANQKEYDENLQIKIKTAIPLSKRYRISNIRGHDGVLIYKEVDRYNAPAMIFEVTSSHADVDPLGYLHYYQSTIKRVPVQENDTSYS